MPTGLVNNPIALLTLDIALFTLFIADNANIAPTIPAIADIITSLFSETKAKTALKALVTFSIYGITLSILSIIDLKTLLITTFKLSTFCAIVLPVIFLVISSTFVMILATFLATAFFKLL